MRTPPPGSGEPLAAPARDLGRRGAGEQRVVDVGAQPSHAATAAARFTPLWRCSKLTGTVRVRPRCTISALPSPIETRRTSAPSASPKVTRPAATPGQVGLEQRLGVRHDGDRAGLELEDLGLGGGDRLDGSHQLEVHRADRRDHADVGRGDVGQVGDLAGAAHPELADDRLGAALDPAQRERDADLVVVVRGARDRPHARAQKRGEDVLGRRLARRAGDARRRAPATAA